MGCLLFRRLMHNLKVHREAMNRFNQITTCFQWLHEEALSQPDGGHQWVGSQRSNTLIPLKRVSLNTPPLRCAILQHTTTLLCNIATHHHSVVQYCNTPPLCCAILQHTTTLLCNIATHYHSVVQYCNTLPLCCAILQHTTTLLCNIATHHSVVQYCNTLPLCCAILQHTTTLLCDIATHHHSVVQYCNTPPLCCVILQHTTTPLCNIATHRHPVVQYCNTPPLLCNIATHHHSVVQCIILYPQATGDQIISSVGTVREKVQSQHFRISQRLQWAACANPSLNLIFDDFERAVNNRNKALQVSLSKLARNTSQLRLSYNYPKILTLLLFCVVCLHFHAL